MKRLFLIVFFALICLPAFATEEATVNTTATTPQAPVTSTIDLSTLLSKLPCLNQDVLYSIKNNTVQYGVDFTVIGFWEDSDKNTRININLGYTPTEEIFASISFRPFNIGKFVQIPLIQYITFEPYAYYGQNGIGKGKQGWGEGDYGAGVKLVSIKF